MKIEHDKVYMRYGKQGKFVDASEITINGNKLGDLLAELQAHKKAYNDLVNVLKDKVIVNKKDNLIIALNGKVHKGKIEAIKLDEGENVNIMKVNKNGKLIKDKKKVGILNE